MAEFRLNVRNAYHGLVAGSDQRVWLRWRGQDLAAVQQGEGYVVALPADLSGPVELWIRHPHYYDFRAVFEVSLNPHLDLLEWNWKEGGLAHAVALNRDRIDSFAFLSKMLRVDTKADPLKIANPEGPNWFHKQLDDRGPYRRGFEMPLIKIKDPILSPDPSAKGARRLVYEVQSPVRPDGRVYAFEYKTLTAPKLVMVWHSAQMDFSKVFPAGRSQGIPYHLYYHPTAHSPAAYPYGRDQGGGQPHVGVGYRHLMFESWASVQHFYSMKRVVFVAPVGSPTHQFGEVGTSWGLEALLRETNLALHAANGADAGNYMGQDLGRVAVSGFSAGADFMIKALLARNSPAGQAFVRDCVKEIYSWDGAIGGAGIPNTVPQSFGKLIKQWWRSEDQVFQVYTQNSAYDKSLSFLDQYAKRTGSGPAGAFVKSYEKKGVHFGTLAVLPDGFFRQNYPKRQLDKDHYELLEDPLKVYRLQEEPAVDPGFPSYVDTHHWFFKVFMYHALVKGRFPGIS